MTEAPSCDVDATRGERRLRRNHSQVIMIFIVCGAPWACDSRTFFARAMLIMWRNASQMLRRDTAVVVNGWSRRVPVRWRVAFRQSAKPAALEELVATGHEQEERGVDGDRDQRADADPQREPTPAPTRIACRHHRPRQGAREGDDYREVPTPEGRSSSPVLLDLRWTPGKRPTVRARASEAVRSLHDPE